MYVIHIIGNKNIVPFNKIVRCCNGNVSSKTKGNDGNSVEEEHIQVVF